SSLTPLKSINFRTLESIFNTNSCLSPRLEGAVNAPISRLVHTYLFISLSIHMLMPLSICMFIPVDIDICIWIDKYLYISHTWSHPWNSSTSSPPRTPRHHVPAVARRARPAPAPRTTHLRQARGRARVTVA